MFWKYYFFDQLFAFIVSRSEQVVECYLSTLKLGKIEVLGLKIRFYMPQYGNLQILLSSVYYSTDSAS